MFDVLCANDNKKGQLFTLRYILHNTYIHTRKPRYIRPHAPLLSTPPSTIESLVNVKNHTELVFFFLFLCPITHVVIASILLLCQFLENYEKYFCAALSIISPF